MAFGGIMVSTSHYRLLQPVGICLKPRRENFGGDQNGIGVHTVDEKPLKKVSPMWRESHLSHIKETN